MTALAMIARSGLSGSQAPVFEESELRVMHGWCIKYRNFVQAGGTPTPDQGARFMKFQRVTYAMGVACG